ncbi:hypothetical protein [Vibrio sp. Hal054]|uniref:hypothetical protein n=1 Tax=Vibrio sp. Hal054 TaxID=3035158 RepID=UPI00301B7065
MAKKPQSKQTIDRANQVWLAFREIMREVIVHNIDQHLDGKLFMPRPLQVPFNPIKGEYFHGMSGLILTHYAYSDYLESRLFEPRFSQYHELNKLGYAIQKGSRSVNYPLVHLYDAVETVNEETGLVEMLYKTADLRYKTYKNVFSIRTLVKKVVPNSASILSDVINPYSTPEGLESFAGGVVRQLRLDVVFNAERTSNYSTSGNRITIGVPQVFSSLFEFYSHLFYQMVISILPIRRFVNMGISVNTHIVSSITAMMLANELLIQWTPVDKAKLVELVGKRPVDDLFFDVMVAEQVYRYFILSSGHSRPLEQLQSAIGTRICTDFFMFSQSEEKGVQAKGQVTMQQSESTVISF